MQVRTYAGYWYDRPGTSAQPLISEVIQGIGEVIVDIGNDEKIDAAGALDYLITPQGTTGDLSYVKYRQLTLQDSASQFWTLDVLWFNTNKGPDGAHSENNYGAMISLDSKQFDSLPNDAGLRIVGMNDYSNPFVPSDYLSLISNVYDTPGSGLWWNNVTFGTFVMNGARADYDLSRDGNSMLRILANDGSIDRVGGFERVVFSDGVIAWSGPHFTGQSAVGFRH
jgi:hypothetical protein